jgi:GT2 family glycosyltransferase
MAAVDFVVCTRNNRTIINDTLRAIERQTIGDFTCTLVDGCSTDGTVAFVREHFPWVSIVVKSADTGPADSRNVGLAAGRAPYVILVDSDVSLSPTWAETQVAFLESDRRIGLAGGKLVVAGSPDVLYGCVGLMNRFGVAWNGGEGAPVDAFATPRPCLWINTSAVIIRRAALADFGSFDAVMFAGHEDSDLGWRANLFGYRVVFNPNAVAAHGVHGTFNPLAVRRLVYLIRRNRIRSVITNYELGSLVRYLLLYLVLAVGDGLMYAPRKEKLTALWWNVRQWGDTLNRRRWVQRRRVVRDRDLWPMFTGGLRGPGYFREGWS